MRVSDVLTQQLTFTRQNLCLIYAGTGCRTGRTAAIIDCVACNQQVMRSFGVTAGEQVPGSVND